MVEFVQLDIVYKRIVSVVLIPYISHEDIFDTDWSSRIHPQHILAVSDFWKFRGK
jgi:hypothetical protein